MLIRTSDLAYCDKTLMGLQWHQHDVANLH